MYVRSHDVRRHGVRWCISVKMQTPNDAASIGTASRATSRYHALEGSRYEFEMQHLAPPFFPGANIPTDYLVMVKRR